MSVNEVCRYMPHAEDTIAGKAEKSFRLLAYHVWKRELMRFLGAQPNAHLRAVDVGCGPGFLLGCLRTWFHDAELIGIDQSEDLLKIAQSRCKSMAALKGDATALPLPDGFADAAFALHVVEHLAQPSQFFTEARRVVRPGGLLVIATPNAEGLGARAMGRRWSGYSDPTHVSLHGPSFWRDMLNKSGFDIAREGTTGLSGIPLLNTMPFGLIHWIPGFFWGYFPWRFGEACVYVAIRRREELANAD
jgi:ubiquinone/menaquinone biosynthesis C-methylase UbiE